MCLIRNYKLKGRNKQNGFAFKRRKILKRKSPDKQNIRGYLRTSMSDIRRNYFRLGGGFQRQFYLSSDIDLFRFGHSHRPNWFAYRENDRIMTFLSMYFPPAKYAFLLRHAH